MNGIKFTVFYLENMVINKIPQQYPEDGTGARVLKIEENTNDYIVLSLNHGSPKSDLWRDRETGDTDRKGSTQIDVEFDYLIVHKESMLLFLTGSFNNKEIRDILRLATNNLPVEVRAFYSAEKLIKKLSVLNEISLYTKKKKKKKKLFSDDGLDEDMNTTLHKDPLGDKAEEVITKFKYNGKDMTSEDRDVIGNLIQNQHYENVSVRATVHEKNFHGIINTKEVFTKIKRDDLSRLNGRIDINDLKESFNIYFESEDFISLRSDPYGYKSK
tara:strand:- start:938 stop:1753 length:816 start_codon:yes stop_codon:yes gene_type:complete